MTTYDNLSNRVAVVTGAASGMGEATALLLAASGAKVVLLARRLNRLTDLAEKIAANGGQALAVAADVADRTAVSAAASQVHERFGPVDLLVNAAGVMLPNPITDGRDDQWTRMIDTNLIGVLRVSDAFLPDLLAAAEAGRTADLVNVSSVGAHLSFQNYAVYCATKAALTHWSATIRTELGPKNVRVTNIEPGLVDTELADHLDPKMAEELQAMFGELKGLPPAAIADLVGFVASRPGHVNLAQVVVQPTRQG